MRVSSQKSPDTKIGAVGIFSVREKPTKPNCNVKYFEYI